MQREKPRGIVLFLFIAFAITWIIGIPIAFTAPPDAEPDPFDIVQLGALGPAIAALILRYLEKGQEGLKEFFKKVIYWRIPFAWYLVILILPLIWSGILPSMLLYLMRNGTLPRFLEPSYGAPSWKNAWWFFLYILVIGGGQEEPGWRGYLLPKLQIKHNAVVSSFLVGLIWYLWHLPFMFIPGSASYGAPVIGYWIQLTSLSFVFTWLYNNTESILACMLYHAWMNFVGAYMMVDIVEPVYGLLMLAVQLAIPVGIVIFFGPLRFVKNNMWGTARRAPTGE